MCYPNRLFTMMINLAGFHRGNISDKLAKICQLKQSVLQSKTSMNNIAVVARLTHPTDFMWSCPGKLFILATWALIYNKNIARRACHSNNRSLNYCDLSIWCGILDPGQHFSLNGLGQWWPDINQVLWYSFVISYPGPTGQAQSSSCFMKMTNLQSKYGCDYYRRKGCKFFNWCNIWHGNFIS